jgi:putative peptidoglycan lipid II flippase
MRLNISLTSTENSSDSKKNLSDKAARAALIMIVFTTVSKALGMVRESAIAGYFGANYQTDAFNIASSVPSILMDSVYVAISAAFIPVYSRMLKNRKEQSEYFASNIFNILTLLSLMMTFAAVVLTPLLIRLIAPGFDTKTHSLAVELTVIMLIPVVFLALSNLANGYLQSHGKFAAPAFMNISNNILCIACIVLFHKIGVKAAAVGYLLGVISQFAVQLPSLNKAGFRLKPVIDLKEEGLKNVTFMAFPVIISCTFNQVYIIIDKILASCWQRGAYQPWNMPVKSTAWFTAYL